MIPKELNNSDELKNKNQHRNKEDETEETPDISASIEKKGSYADSPADKARTHKGPIGIDRDPNSI